MNPFVKMIMIISLITGTLMAITSSHWILAWIGLEINTFAILPLMNQKYYPRTIEATTKYFIIQTAAATMLLFSTILNAWLTGEWEIQQTSHPLILMLVTIALMLKMGLAPLHAWFPEVMQGLKFSTGLILSTLQKLAPFSLLLQLTVGMPILMSIFGLLSILIGGWGGMNQTQTRKILSYSSIAHFGWMLLIIQYMPSLAFTAFMIYVIMTSTMFMMFWFNQSTTMNTLLTSWPKTPALLIIMPLILMSLGGLPPLTGFIPKWFILSELVKHNLVILSTTAALVSLMSFSFYLRMSYAMAHTSSPNFTFMTLPWHIETTYPLLPLAICIGLSIYILPLASMILAMTPY
uniref:NADH-ubiquinone oxidoreductase chain 2 n=1 Tax=Papiliolebias bitteri TaxID=135293 RepID=Q9TD16_9TELE|nr:NADH dehydrogenase subunit II [Papiliolebias bitteri]